MSKEKQQFIKRMMTMSFIKNFLAIIFVVLSLFAMFSIFSQLFLQSYFADITLQTIRSNNPSKEINAKVEHINNTTKKTEAIQSEYIQWTPYLSIITQAIPTDITLTMLSFNHSEGIVSISGTAPNRDSLLRFKDALEALDQIDTVTIPLSDLTKKDSIPFSFSLPFAY